MEFDDCISSAMVQVFHKCNQHTLPICWRQWFDIDRMRQRRIHVQRNRDLLARVVSQLVFLASTVQTTHLHAIFQSQKSSKSRVNFNTSHLLLLPRARPTRLGSHARPS
jgi:hypothetical protein